MSNQWKRALVASLLLILSSLAGCFGGDEEPESATVIASTYHVAQLAEAVGGGLVDVEMMSTSNVPVHDYEPSATDIIRLNSADVFLYHGLGLEPWVDGALADLADDGPATYSTHAMPSGEDTLDFQSILINKLCTSMTGPATTDVHTLAHHPHEAEELHGDDGGHNFAFPDHGEEHDHDEDEHDHGDHDEDEHDHGDHDALSPEMTFDNPEGCDAGTSINVFHMEAGEYMLEFESESEDPFRMAIAGMGGAHDHGHGHGHGGHGDGGFEWAGVFEMSDSTHTWSMQKVDGAYADPTMWLVLIPTDSPTEDTMHDLEGGIDALVDAGCTVVEDGESMSSIAADGTCFELHVGTGVDSTFTIDTAGITGMAMYAQHVPTEFERDQHYLKDSAGEDIEPVAQEGAGAHDHGHGEEGHEEHFVCHDMTTHENHDEYTNEADCEAAGHSWMEDAHGEDGPVCHDEATHENHDEYTNEADCEAAGHHWMESGEEEHHHFAMTVVLDDATHHFEVEEDEAPANASGMMDVGMAALNLSVGMDSGMVKSIAGDASPDDWSWYWQLHLWNESSGAWEASNKGSDDVVLGEDFSNAGDDPSSEAMFIAWAKNTTDDTTIPAPGEPEHEDEGMGFVGLHVEEEGDYGIALPAGVSLHILEAVHEGHDHGGHGGDVFEWAGVFEMSDSTHTWSMQKVDGDYADPTMWLVLIPTDSPTEDTMHDLEGGIDALVDAGCTVVEDGESMSSIAADGTCFELHVGTGVDSTFTIDTAGITGMAMYAQHVPTEFERDQHYLKDSAGVDIEPVAQEGAGAHDHGHGEEEIAFDPHSWLDPVAYAAQVEVVYTALSAAFPDNADAFRDNADAYKAQLAELDAGFSAAFGESGTCQKNTVAANHNAYAYISQRYGIEFVNLHGIDPEGEPSPAAVAEVLERVRDDGVTAIYVEEYTPNGALDSLIQDTKSDDLPNGIEVLTLHTLEMAPADSSDNYITLMTENLENLKIGLAC